MSKKSLPPSKKSLPPPRSQFLRRCQNPVLIALALLLLFLPSSIAPPPPGTTCDSWGCDYCLHRVPTVECGCKKDCLNLDDAAYLLALPVCSDINDGELCRSSNNLECGTNNETKNCFIASVYRRLACEVCEAGKYLADNGKCTCSDCR